jgi:DNA polymerase, archaea type
MSDIISTPNSDFSAGLFGQNPETHIVAVEPDFNEGVWIYKRTSNGVQRSLEPFQPWVLLTAPPPFDLSAAQITELNGEGYTHLVEFENQAAYTNGRFLIRDAHLSNLTYPGGGKSALIRSGRTLFKGMTFDDIVRLQFDIETDSLTPENGHILLIAIADNRGLVELIEGDERDILERFVQIVLERDPDVIEGHNLYGFDFPFVLTRAQKHGIRLPIGRDGSEPRLGGERNYAIAAGGNTRPFRPVYVHGRHVLDTYLIVQRFDWAKQALTSYGLKECARVFGFAEVDRVELPRDRIAEIYRDDPETVRTYARQDVVETGKLAALITPVEFYQTQMIPDNYASVAVTGNGEKINAIFIRAYLAANQAVARMQPARPYAGGYSEVRRVGVMDRIVKADVESLYPSLMLTHKIAPSGDTLGVFLPALKELTARRIDAKRRAAQADNTADGHYWDGLQGSFKVLINSFYGYLGGPFYFNDYDAAERVTEEGRRLVVDVAERMEASGSHVIEIDTDGVYFVPPAHIQEEAAERSYVGEIGAALPEGIRLAFDGRFAAMLSVKTKNYVLVTYDGRKIYKGASLRSRADERYGRRFLAKAVDFLLAHDFQAVSELYAQTIDDLLHHRIPIDDLIRRERVTENTFQSEQKKRSATVAQGVAVGDFLLVYEKADGSLGKLEEFANDENVKYYMDKLYKFAKRLEEVFGGAAEFQKCIPKPTAQGLPQKLQTTLDLF